MSSRLLTSSRLVLVLAAAALATLVAAPSFAAGAPKKDAPKSTAESLYNAGVDQMKQGDYASAAGNFSQAVEMNPKFAEAHSNLAYCLRKQGKDHYDVALAHYNTAIELDPKLAQAYHYRGVLHALSGDVEAAKADHAKLMELDRELADELMKVIASGEEPAGHGGAAGWN
jgi:tetratricopeptide (TPR) repeat protein